MTAVPLLEVEAVSKRRIRGALPINVLKAVSFEVYPGEVAAIWGARGSGKTTVLEIVAGIQAPDAGLVRLAGQDLSKLSTKQLAGNLQTTVGFATRSGPASRDLPVVDWIAAVLVARCGWRSARRHAFEGLRRVGATDVAEEPWNSLSEVERTLVAVAQAAVRKPKLLLVDDLVAGLGLRERGSVMAQLRSLASEEGNAVLMTATEIADVQDAKPIWSLGGGELVGRPSATSGSVLDFSYRRASGQG